MTSLRAQTVKIKMLFIVLVTGIMISFVVGSSVLKESHYMNYFNARYTMTKFEAITDRLRFAFATSPDIFSGVRTIFAATASYQAGGTHAESVPVLLYHGILSTPEPGTANVTKDNFLKQMFALKAAGYQTVSLDDLYRFKRGEITLPEKSFVITFDDGRADSFYGADPVLRALDYKATIFVITKYALNWNNRYYLSRVQLQDMANSGTWTLQGHSKNGHDLNYVVDPVGSKGHFYGNKLWLIHEKRFETDEEFRTRVADDFAGTKQDLEQQFGTPVTAFAYPFGDFGQNSSNYPNAPLVDMTEAEKDYSMIFYQFRPGEYYSQIYPFTPRADATTTNHVELHRIEVKDEWTAQNLLNKLAQGASKPLPYTEDFTKNNGWYSNWGVLSFSHNDSGAILDLKADKTATGGFAMLDGTEAWKNYSLTATVNTPSKTSIFAWARLQTDSNNVGCNFGKDFVHIEQTLNGVHTVIAGMNNTPPIPDHDFTIGVSVHDRTIECSVDGKVITSTQFIDPSLDHGGIGFKTWDQAPGSELIIKSLHVASIQ